MLFPASDATAILSAGESIEATSWRGSETVLIVDDEEIIRNMAQSIIEQAGFSVLAASDGEEAMGLYRQHQKEIVCVLLDLTMPKMNGDETLCELYRVNPQARVILSSGYSEASATERFSGLGLAGFLQKPYHLDAMMAAIRKAVAGGMGAIPGSSQSDVTTFSAIDRAATRRAA